MRILYFSRDYTTHDRRFLSKLAESGHTVWFLRLEDDDIPYEKRPLPESIHPIDWKGGHQPADTVEAWLSLMPAFEAVLNDVQPDLIHAGPVQSCGLMTALTGFHPFLVMSWGSDILLDADRDEMWRWLTRYTLKHSDMLVCDSQAVRTKVQQLTPYADERIVQFPWGIDLHQFAPGADSLSLRRRLGWDDTFIVLSTRSWEPIYGIDVLLEAFRLAYTQESRLRLLLLGTGSLSGATQQFTAYHKLEDAIFQPGMVSHALLPNFFRAVNLYLTCAQSDGTSISLLEAMATGLPVVVTDVPGNREWVIEGQNGWLAPAGDIETFAELLLLAADLTEAERRQIGERNRAVTVERANWDTNFAKLLEAYEQARVMTRRHLP